MSTAADVIAGFTAERRTLAIAESLTGGLLTSTLVDVPGASAVVRGGIVAYQTDVKSKLLGVDAELLATAGAVDPRVAEQMAVGAAGRLEAACAVATTGVAGPDPQDGRPVGTVFIGLARGTDVRVERFAFSGDRAGIRRQTVDAALDLLLESCPGDAGNPKQRRPK